MKDEKSTRDTVFDVRDLAKVYRMGQIKVHALRGANPELYAGALIVLLGPSGSGKSILLKIIGMKGTSTILPQ